jgi:hypothetical protein
MSLKRNFVSMIKIREKKFAGKIIALIVIYCPVSSIDSVMHNMKTTN